ncbi:Mitochondrial outer membrane translocase subunit Tom5 protein [Rutstroemia sp. NJR-2017a WRK4]|nr:Mitochondrial outer membrane translocase subunit Tom5 protein [Rutstroemia sp. NJR-2017a WRK4]
MFGGREYPSVLRVPAQLTNIISIAPPQLTQAELKAQEAEASQTVQRVIVGAILLYLSPFAINTIKNLV